MERKWNENGTKMERKWNENGTNTQTNSLLALFPFSFHFRSIFVPLSFHVRSIVVPCSFNVRSFCQCFSLLFVLCVLFSLWFRSMVVPFRSRTKCRPNADIRGPRLPQPPTPAPPPSSPSARPRLCLRTSPPLPPSGKMLLLRALTQGFCTNVWIQMFAHR